MSATAWNRCPKCLKNASNILKTYEKQKKESYGKVSEEQYLNQILRIESYKKEIDDEYDDEKKFTLRLDYHVNMSDTGKFDIAFSAVCDKCGFIHKFKHSELVLQ